MIVLISDYSLIYPDDKALANYPQHLLWLGC